MSKTLILTFIFSWLSLNTYAAVDLQSCSKQIGINLWIPAGAVGDVSFQQPFKVDGNKISINDPSAIVSKEISENKEIYKYKVNLGGGIFEIRTLEVTKDASGNYTITKQDDLSAQKKAAKASGYYYPSMENYPMQSGAELKYSSKTGKCELVQGTTLKVMNGKKFIGEVFVDKKYCDQIHDITKNEGQAKTQQCVDLLDKVQKVFTERQEELSKDNKTFGQFEAGTAGAAMKLAMCAPSEFKIREQALRGFGMGDGYFNMGSGIGMDPYGMNGVAPEKKSTEKGVQ